MEDLQVTLVIAVVAVFIAMLAAGAANKIVIYFDARDLFISFMPWGSILLGIILLNVYQHEGQLDFDALSGTQSFILYASISLSAIFFIWSMNLSMIHNRSITLGLLVGVLKMLFSLLSLLIWVGQVLELFSDLDWRIHLILMLVFGAFIVLRKKLINGEQVYLAKGWVLPEREEAPAQSP